MDETSDNSSACVQLSRGVFVVSIDLELAWGTFDHGGYARYRRSFDRVRPIITALLEMLGRHGVQVTFAAVGHLFLDRCSRENGVAHPEMVHPRHAWHGGDWYSMDPCTDLQSAPHWYGRDLIEQIAADGQGHEIGSHSFSHAIFDDPGCSAATARSELDRCAALAREVAGRELRSFVFPRNRPGHLDVLGEKGFRVFRAPDPWWSDKLPARLLRRLGHFADDLLALRPPTVSPQRIEPPGIWSVAGSMLYQSRYGLRRLIPVGARVRKAIKGIDAAVDRKEVFQLWFHPFNLADDEEALLAGLDRILAHATRRRERGELDVLTLGELAARCDAQCRSAPRKPAIAVHERDAGLFEQRYRDLLQRPYRSAFTYGRRQVDEIVDRWLGPPAGRKLLDVGCGTGFHLQAWRRGGFACVGLDGAMRMLAGSEAAGVPLIRGDAERLPLRDEVFDVVVSIEVLRYLEEAPRYVRELRRVLRPGGTCIVTAAPRWSMHGYALAHGLSHRAGFGRYGKLWQRFDTVGSLRRLFEENGFEDIEIAGCFLGPFVLLEKVSAGVNEWALRRWEGLDRRLSRRRALRNFCNHLLVRGQRGM